MVNNDHITGFVAGAAVTALALYWYDQNRERIDQFLQAQRMGVGQPSPYWTQAPGHSPPASSGDQPPTLEELMAQKERLEDQIAELEASQKGKAK